MYQIFIIFYQNFVFMETWFHVDVVFSTKLTKYSSLYGEVGIYSDLVVDVFGVL